MDRGIPMGPVGDIIVIERLSDRVAKLESEITEYRVRIENAIVLIEQMPAIDENADPNDTSPEDMIAHLSGLILQVLKGAKP